MRTPPIRETARRLRVPALALATVLVTACNPKDTGDVAGGTGTGSSGAFDKAAVVSYAHLLMTVNTASSTLGWKANGTQKGSGTVYLGTLLSDTVRFSASTPLVTFEATNGGSTRFLSEARLLSDGQRYRAFAYGIIGSTDPNFVPSLLFAPLDSVTPLTNTAHARFAHFMPGTGPVDVYTGAPGAEVRVVTALPYGGLSDYLDITAPSASVASTNIIVTPTGVARGAGTNIMSIVGLTTVTNPNAYTLALIYPQSNFTSPGSRTLAIYQER